MVSDALDGVREARRVPMSTRLRRLAPGSPCAGTALPDTAGPSRSLACLRVCIVCV